MFAMNAQHRPAGHEDFDARTACQKFYQSGRCQEHMFKVIYQQQEMPFTQVSFQAF